MNMDNGVAEMVAAVISRQLAVTCWEKATGRRDPGSLGPGLCWVNSVREPAPSEVSTAQIVQSIIEIGV